MKIGYVFTEVPQIAGMFPNAELEEMAARGAEIEIFILRNKPALTPEAQRIEARFAVHRRPYLLHAGLLGDCIAGVVRHPLLFARAVAQIVRDAAGSPRILAKSLGVLPKSIHFAALARRQGITLLHAYWASLPALGASLMSRYSGVPFTTWAHAGSDIYNRNHQTEAALRSRLREARLVLTCNRANLPHFEQLAGRRALDRVVLLTHGVDTARFKEREEGQDGAGAARTLSILAVGRLSRAKGFDVLVDSCAILKERGVAFTCSIVGTGAERETLRARVLAAGLNGEVTMPGHVDHTDLPRLYVKSDIFVMPSVIGPKGSRDGLPNVLLEAMASGMACIGSAVASIPEAIEAERTGILVDPGDPRALAAGIERLAADPDLRLRLGSAAAALVRERYGREPAMNELFRVFTDLHQPPGPTPLRSR